MALMMTNGGGPYLDPIVTRVRHVEETRPRVASDALRGAEVPRARPFRPDLPHVILLLVEDLDAVEPLI